MLMTGIVMAVSVGVTGPVRMHVFVLVKDDLQLPSERIRDAAECGKARDVIAPLETRDHGFGHRKPFRELLLCLPGAGAKLEQTVGALRGDGGTVIECWSSQGASSGLRHGWNLAILRSSLT